MSKTTVQTVADELGKEIQRQQDLVSRMRLGQIGRRKAYEELKQTKERIGSLVGRLGSM